MRVLITGAGGQLGRDLVDAFSGTVPAGGLRDDPATGRLGVRPAWQVVGASHRQLDVSDRDAVLAAIEGVRPDVVVHAGAWTEVDACEGDPARAFATNAMGTRHVAEACRRFGGHVVYVSTDYVFDGTSPRPYVEWDQTCPTSVYGRSKLGGEKELSPESTTVRTSWVNGAHGNNMVKTVLRLAERPGSLRFVDDQRGCPTFTADLAGAICVLATGRLPGTFHVTNQGACSWYEFARAVLDVSGHDGARVEPISTPELVPPRPAPRPANSVLENAAMRFAGLSLLPEWRDALERMVPLVADLAESGSGDRSSAGVFAREAK
jgi:dTDP-4-dehydrorhamnose reductase